MARENADEWMRHIRGGISANLIEANMDNGFNGVAISREPQIKMTLADRNDDACSQKWQEKNTDE
jgi:hypothetical protein